MRPRWRRYLSPSARSVQRGRGADRGELSEFASELTGAADDLLELSLDHVFRGLGLTEGVEFCFQCLYFDREILSPAIAMPDRNQPNHVAATGSTSEASESATRDPAPSVSTTTPAITQRAASAMSARAPSPRTSLRRSMTSDVALLSSATRRCACSTSSPAPRCSRERAFEMSAACVAAAASSARADRSRLAAAWSSCARSVAVSPFARSAAL